MPSFGFRKPPCSRGVTLIEIMIVIAIMMILMGLIMAVIGPVRKAAKERSTRLLLDGIASNMARYHMEFDDFPIDTVNPLKPDGSVTTNRGTEDAGTNDFADDGSIYRQMNGDPNDPDPALRGGPIKARGSPYEKRLDPFLKLQPENIRKEGVNLIIYDFFSRPIRYCNSEIWLRSGGDVNKVHNPKIDLWSLGDSATKSEDDIKNWQ